MKVLHVIPSLSAVHGGPSRAMRSIEQALLARGIEIETATTDDDGPGKRKDVGRRHPVCNAPGSTVLNEADHDGRAHPSDLASLPASIQPIRRYFLKRIEFYKVSPGFAWWILGHVRGYDLVHIHALFSFTSVIAAWAARRARVPYVIRPLGTLNQYGLTQRRPWLKQLSLKLIEVPILRHAAAVHFTAEAERAEVETLGVPMRSVIIPLGIPCTPNQDKATFLARFPMLSRKRVVLFLSRIDPKKNVEGLLKAFRRIGGDTPDLMLVVAGDGDAEYVEALQQMAVGLGLDDRVVWPGFVDGELKASAYAAAQIFVLPSFSENFGIAAAEALMAGLPCVLGEGVAIAKEAEDADAGFAVAPEPESIAQALRRLLDDENLRARMGLNAAMLATKRYSLEAMGRNLEALYSRILSR